MTIEKPRLLLVDSYDSFTHKYDPLSFHYPDLSYGLSFLQSRSSMSTSDPKRRRDHHKKR